MRLRELCFTDVHSLDVSSAHVTFSLFLSLHGFFSALIFVIVFYFITRERGGKTQQLTLTELQRGEKNLRGGQGSKAVLRLLGSLCLLAFCSLLFLDEHSSVLLLGKEKKKEGETRV